MKTEPNGKSLRGRGFRFTRVRLGNWMNFLEVDQPLQSRVFLVGPNASGKSNLLDVFRFLRDVAAVGGGFQAAVRRRNGVSGIRCLSARKYPSVLIDVSIGNEEHTDAWRYVLEFTQDNNQTARIVREQVLREGENILDRPNGDDNDDPERLTQTFLEQVNSNRDFREVHEFLGAVRYLHVVPQLVREPERSVGRSNDPYGGDFLEQIAGTTPRTQEARLRKITDALRFAVPQLKEIVLKRDRGVPHLRGRYGHWRAQGAWQSEDQFSDGTLRLLGILWALLDGWGPLLLEEPELSLHPEVVRILPGLFARIQHRSKRQILVTTHSPEFLRDPGIGLDELFLLIPGDEGTDVRSAGSIQEVKDLLDGGLSLADAVMPRVRPKDVQQLMLFGE